MSKKTSARPLNALETRLHQAVLSSTEITAKAAEAIIPDPRERSDALNHLLSVGLLKLLNSSKGVSFRAVSKSEHARTVGLTEEEKVVLGYIRASQNEGIWAKHLKAKSNFHKTVLDRSIKTLEQKRLIKTVPSVQFPTRKIYMLEGLAPSVALTGGPWYTDGEFDTEFMETLMKACFKFIRDMSFPKARGRHPEGALYPISKSPKYPSAEQVRNALKKARLTETDLTVEHVETLLNVLVLDGEIEKLPSFGTSLWDAGALDDDDSADEKRTKKKRKHHHSSDSEDNVASKRKNKKSRMQADSDSNDDTFSSKKKAKRKKRADTDDSDAAPSRSEKRKSKKKRFEGSDEEDSSDDELTYKRKSKQKKKSRDQVADSDSDSDSDDGRRRSKTQLKRSPSPEFSFSEPGGSLYRAVREERVFLGWSQAPCSVCPSFEFCKSGGPVNAQECVYYGDWLASGTVAEIEDTLA